jgi:hypothetical protein
MEQLDRIEAKLDELLRLLRPVHAHASWVDGLRERLAQLRLMPNTKALTGPEEAD